MDRLVFELYERAVRCMRLGEIAMGSLAMEAIDDHLIKHGIVNFNTDAIKAFDRHDYLKTADLLSVRSKELAKWKQTA